MCVNIFHEFSSTQVRKSNQRGMSECHIEKSAVEIACVGLERCNVPQRAPWTSLRTWVQLSRTHIKKPGVVVCAFASSARQQRQGDPSDILAAQSAELLTPASVTDLVSRDKAEHSRKRRPLLASGFSVHIHANPHPHIQHIHHTAGRTEAIMMRGWQCWVSYVG